MAFAASYTEATFYSAFLTSVAGKYATLLGWTAQSNYQVIIDRSLARYGTADITTITSTDGLNKLRDIGTFELWRRVKEQLTLNVQDSGAQRAMEDKISSNLEDARRELLKWGEDGYYVGLDHATNIHDPYQYTDEDNRLL